VADTHSIDLKLKRLRVIEGDYRSAIKRAEHDCENNFISREKMLKIKKKYEAKIDKVAPKLRRLRHLRNEMKSKG
jgi:predicted ATP-binding protein involved in virulence